MVRAVYTRSAQISVAVHTRGNGVISKRCASIVDIMPDAIEIGLDMLGSVRTEVQGMKPYGLKKRWDDTIAPGGVWAVRAPSRSERRKGSATRCAA